MRYTAAWPLLAILLVTAAASCGAAAAATPLLPHLASSMRTGRLLQAPAKSAAAPPTFVGKNETVVPDTLDQNTGMAWPLWMACAHRAAARSFPLQVAARPSLCRRQQPWTETLQIAYPRAAEQVKIVDLFSDKELPANRAVHLTDSYYRVVGTQVKQRWRAAGWNATDCAHFCRQPCAVTTPLEGLTYRG